jgi:coenzyme F420-0:L-glutamate ligase / coenzyme F420-1:gamma-L-glutamate ligase
VEDQAVRIVRRRGPLVIAETRHGFICANAGVDRSNAAPGTAVLLPEDPDRSARRLRDRLGAELGVRPAVVITDTFGRPWRRGLVDVAIGVAGMFPIVDLRGTTDSFGRVLDVTEVNVADEVAAAADLVMGKATGICAALSAASSSPRARARSRKTSSAPRKRTSSADLWVVGDR